MSSRAQRGILLGDDLRLSGGTSLGPSSLRSFGTTVSEPVRSPAWRPEACRLSDRRREASGTLVPDGSLRSTGRLLMSSRAQRVILLGDDLRLSGGTLLGPSSLRSFGTTESEPVRSPASSLRSFGLHRARDLYALASFIPALSPYSAPPSIIAAPAIWIGAILSPSRSAEKISADSGSR